MLQMNNAFFFLCVYCGVSLLFFLRGKKVECYAFCFVFTPNLEFQYPVNEILNSFLVQLHGVWLQE
jgi:hypothetical protein